MRMKYLQQTLLWLGIIFIIGTSSAQAYTKQELITTLTKAGQAYWDQKVVIEHTDTGQRLYGFSGQQTVIEEGRTRYYDTDQTFVPDPHIFTEAEDSQGIAGVLYTYVEAYEKTSNKFFLRAAKSLGDTLVQAQIDNGTGGWWHDMGVLADGVDHGKFVNYFPWGDGVHAEADYQHIGDNDGASYLQAMALLRLEQVLPEEDSEKGGKYLNGAKWYADTLVNLKDVTLVREGVTYHPYGNGGIPQMFPFDTLTDGRTSIDMCRNCSYPADYPEGFREYSHNVMITLNDDAMVGAVMLLGEIAKEAKTNTNLDEMKYLTAGRLNIDYLLERAADLAAPSGNSAWATAYYIQDGSTKANQPTWLRSSEPPGFYPQSFADDLLVYWYKNVETDATRLAEINTAMAKHALFWKYDAKVINGEQSYLDIIAGVDGSDPVLTGPARAWTRAEASYNPDSPLSWYHWYVVNHDSSTGEIGVPVSGPDPIECKEFGDNCYTRTTGFSAVYRKDLTNGNFYSYQEEGYPPLIGESTTPTSPANEIQSLLAEATTSYNWEHNLLEHYHTYNPDRRLFYIHEHDTTKVNQALVAFDETNNFFNPIYNKMVRGELYTVIADNYFIRRMSSLVWGINNQGTGNVIDSDGDGYLDTEEDTAGSDINDSDSTPDSSSITTRADVDQSGTINSTDALLTLRNSLDLIMSDTNWQVSGVTGDATCNGSTNSTDALLILRNSLGLDMSGTGWCVS